MPNDHRANVVFAVTMRRQPADPRWVLGEMRRRWYDVSERASSSSLYAEAWVDCSGMNETETVAAVLADLRLAVLDRMA